jgi:hypothetical protein
LVTKGENFGLQGGTGSKTGGDQSQKCDEKRVAHGPGYGLTNGRTLCVFRLDGVFGTDREDDVEYKCAVLISAVRTAWPATRSTHSFFKFRACALNVLTSGFRFLDGDNPADPLIPREWRNVLPFCARGRVRNENFS